MKQTFEGEDLPGGGLGKPLQADLTGQGQAHPTAAQQEANLLATRVLRRQRGRDRQMDKLLQSISQLQYDECLCYEGYGGSYSQKEEIDSCHSVVSVV